MRMKLGEEETLLQDGSTETSVVELNHIFFHMSVITFYMSRYFKIRNKKSKINEMGTNIARI
jgi:hypothetical protein